MRMEMRVPSEAPAKPTKCIYDPGTNRLWSKYHVDDMKRYYGDLEYKKIMDKFRDDQEEDFICVNDDKQRFMRYLKRKLRNLQIYKDFNLEGLSSSLFQFDSVKCVTAILDGETKGLIDDIHDLPFYHDELPPLRCAACWTAPRLVQLLLDRLGTHLANSRMPDDEFPLPLHKALETWGRGGYQNQKPTHSIVWHVIELCNFDQRGVLETVRILSDHTEDVEQEFMKYALEGSVNEVTGLLLAAREKVMPTGSAAVKNKLLQEIVVLIAHDAKSALFGASDGLPKKWMFMQIILVLLEIFDKLGDKLFTYLCQPVDLGPRYDDEAEDWIWCQGHDVSDEIKSLFHGAGICVTSLDRFVSNLTYRSLPEHFTDQLSIQLPMYNNVSLEGSPNAQQFLYAKVQGPVQDIISADDAHKSPLDLALKALRFHPFVSEWTPTKSIFKLIYIFCMPELRGPLKAIGLLASDITMVEQIGAQCVEDGKIVELAALLMVSWDLLVRGNHSDMDNSFVGRHILSQLEMALDQESQLSCSNSENLLQIVRRRKGELLFALSMFEILKIARSSLENYRLMPEVKSSEVVSDVSNLLRGLGFCLKSEDVDVHDVECLLGKVKYEQSDLASGNEIPAAHWAKMSHQIQKPELDVSKIAEMFVPSSYARGSFYAPRSVIVRSAMIRQPPAMRRMIEQPSRALSFVQKLGSNSVLTKSLINKRFIRFL